MTTYVALLRGINSGQNPSQKMDSLRQVFENLGLKNVRSVIASGNVIFESNSTDAEKLADEIETALLEATGVVTATILRTKEQIEQLIAADPFRVVSAREQQRPNVTFFKHIPELDQLPTNGYGFTGYGLVGGAFCYTVDMKTIKTPEAMLTLEKIFGKTITTRTWGTVLKIGALLDGDSR